MKIITLYIGFSHLEHIKTEKIKYNYMICLQNLQQI